jgi:hypothetical protein
MQDNNHSYESHVGDITLGLKRVMYSNLRRGSILALQGGILPPTGSKKLGGNGTTVFEPFLSFDQLFPTNTWVQFQMGSDLPRHPDITPQSLYWYTALGQTLSGDHRLGREWSPMVEFLANRDLKDGAKTDWDVLPEMQVTISRRQHIRAALGVRTPFTDTAGRSPQVNLYLLWDWADGKFWRDGDDATLPFPHLRSCGGMRVHGVSAYGCGQGRRKRCAEDGVQNVRPVPGVPQRAEDAGWRRHLHRL